MDRRTDTGPLVQSEEELALAELQDMAEHVVGRESAAWTRWWNYASLNPVKLRTALLSTLLSLGPPAHPAMLTRDLKQIVLASGPSRRRNSGLDYAKFCNVFEIQQDRMQPYVDALNDACVQHGLVFRHCIHDPAQFRKLFAGMVSLHACKGGE